MPESPRAAVFVHGAGGGGWEWGIWSRCFRAEGFAVAAPDLHAGEDGLACTSLHDYSAQVAGWVGSAREGGAASVVLIGASLGGLLALANAGAAQALVLVNPLPPTGLPGDDAELELVPWGREASLAGTRRALPDADELAALHAFRRWRDESGLALRQARAGWPLPAPACPVLVMGSAQDAEVPLACSRALAASLGAAWIELPGSHVGPLLGRQAAGAARLALGWLNSVPQGA